MSLYREERRLLEELLEEKKREIELLEKFGHSFKDIIHRLGQIEHELRHKEPARFRVTQESTNMITGIIPGQTGAFVATPLDAAGSPITTPLSVVPVWTSSDPLAVITPSADGLSCSVAVDGTAPQGGSFALTIANPDGSGSVSTTVPYDKVTPLPNVPASFAVNQTA